MECFPAPEDRVDRGEQPHAAQLPARTSYDFPQPLCSLSEGVPGGDRFLDGWLMISLQLGKSQKGRGFVWGREQAHASSACRVMTEVPQHTLTA